MINSQYKTEYKRYLDLFNEYSEKVFSAVKTESNLSTAMAYSFFAGGKRVRPVLMLAFADILGGDLNRALPFAFSLECIHTHSLIHDDLPALDGDVLRRGKPTCHVEFDEATAILAGDALLNLAYEHSLSSSTTLDDIHALECLAKFTGYRGMMQGQQIDVENEGKGGDEELLLKIHDLKTCKLLTVPFLIPAILYRKELMPLCKKLGRLIGLIFQFTDDVLDVLGEEEKLGKSVGKDQQSQKLTSISLYGVDGVKSRVNQLEKEAKNIIKSIDNTGFLQCFLSETVGRQI